MTNLLRRPATARRSLSALLHEERPVLAPGCYDPLGARLVEEAGFPAVYMTGFGTAAGRLGRPDVGLLTMSEMVDNARRIVEVTDLPVIADADTGYGNPLNVIRTVQEYERAGVAAIHIEDQVTPKKCGHMERKQLVTPTEMIEKVRAAVEARLSPELLVIARTDARAVEGLAGALRRGRRYLEAGADLLFVEAPQSDQEVAEVAAAFPDTPLLFNWAEGGKTPPVGLARLRELGYALVIFPITTLLAATSAMRAALAAIRRDGTPTTALAGLPGFGEFLDFIGMREVTELERRFGSRQEAP